MKRILLISLSLIILLSGCSNDSFDYDESKSVPPLVNPITRVVSSDQAKAFADKAVIAILAKNESPATRSTESRNFERNIKDVLAIKANDGDTALYAINFNENKGFMIISADKEAFSAMLAFSDSSNFQVNTLVENSPMGEWLREQRDRIAQNLKNGITNKNRESYQLWEYICGNDKEIEIELQLVNFPDEIGAKIPTTRGTHKDSWGLTQVYPSFWITAFLWGQGQGYNANAPRPGIDLAGCPAVAAGLLCNHWAFPNDYSYWMMPTRLINVSTPNAISFMFRDIADRMPGYTWGSGGSGASGASILTGLKSLGYSNAIHATYNFNLVYNNILNGRPVLLGGQAANGGHVWIADGYWEQTWKVTQKFLGIVINTWYEYSDMLYMNWGWDGSNNSWVDQAEWSFYNNSKVMWYNLYPI